jgi:23S rRNA (cytidine1920-2'-O)/16S rRNA (cytidine1409-2'-O)-methyltransferase
LKKRLDVLLTERGEFSTREKAKAAVMAGLVYIDGRLEDKAGAQVSEDADIEVRGEACPYVSRGGFKLEKALRFFGIPMEGKHCVDIGASTGGFTDVMLQSGAEKVYAVDVGYGQLDWKLRSDPRVVCMEKVNFRYLDPASMPEKLDFACCDVSFISISKILPVAAKLLKDEGEMVSLIKPQFEAGREQVGKNGIVRDAGVHREVIERAIAYAHDAGFGVFGLTYSPVRGAKGNIEFLIHLKKTTDGEAYTDPAVVVAEARSGLSGQEEA